MLNVKPNAAGIVEIPSHVTIGHQVDVLANYLAHRGHALEVLVHAAGPILGPVTETHLHRREALVTRRHVL